MTDPKVSIDPVRLRRVLGRYPTGVCVVAAKEEDGTPVGMTVGTFTSVSLDPPMVGFLPAKTSTSWPRIRNVGRFSINVLSEEQEGLCRTFATKSVDKFAGVPWSEVRPGSVVLDDAVAWIDCDLGAVHDAGDHLIVSGSVKNFDVGNSAMPLMFFQGGYGRFFPRSLVSGDTALTRELRLVDLARQDMEHVASVCGTRCLAAVSVGEKIVLMGTAGTSPSLAPDFVGESTPLRPGGGNVFIAYARSEVVDSWLSQFESDSQRESWLIRLQQVRERGYSVAVRSPVHERFERMLESGEIWGDDGEPTAAALSVMAELPYDPVDFSSDDAHKVRSLHAPVFGPSGTPLMALSVFTRASKDLDGATLEHHAQALVDAANRITMLNLRQNGLS